jgi:two-component system response regulator GlrR
MKNGQNQSAGKLLVVDDDSNLVELVAMKLQAANYNVATALTEEDALKAATNEVFDLCIVDLKLAGRNGISLMTELHAVNPEMPVIILTGHASVESAVEAMKKGAYGYLTKPFNTPELLLQIERALENRRLNSESKTQGAFGGAIRFYEHHCEERRDAKGTGCGVSHRRD